MSVKPIPEGYHTLTPYLSVHNARGAIDFYRHAFGAVERFAMAMPDGKIAHAELRIGDSIVMLADNPADGQFEDPRALGGTGVGLHLYVPDVDALFNQAVEAGAEVLKPVNDQFYGDRSGVLRDPYGHVWFIATHCEDVSEEEIRRRAEALFSPVA